MKKKKVLQLCLQDDPTQALLPNLADHMDMARPPHENPEYLVPTGLKSARAHPLAPEPFQPPASFSTVQVSTFKTFFSCVTVSPGANIIIAHLSVIYEFS
jgi:hypothetical protein